MQVKLFVATDTAMKWPWAHIGNSKAITERLKNTFYDMRVPADTIIVTMDVVALNPSIPIEDGIVAVLEKLKRHQHEIDWMGLRIADIEVLTRFVLENNYFKFGQTTYRHRKESQWGTTWLHL